MVQLGAREGEVEEDPAKGEEEQHDARIGADLPSAANLCVLRVDGGARRRRRLDEDVVHVEERDDDDADDGEGELVRVRVRVRIRIRVRVRIRARVRVRLSIATTCVWCGVSGSLGGSASR